MARLEAAIYSILSNDANVIAIVSTRIYPLLLPQDADLPALTYSRISTERESAFMTDPGLSTARIQIDVWAETVADMMNLSEKVRAALHRYTPGTAGGCQIVESHIDNEISLYEPDTEVYHMVIDFMILHVET